MSSYDQYGAASSYGTDANFQANYRLTPAFLDAHKAPFVSSNRIWIGGYNIFQTDISDYDALLTSKGMAHSTETPQNMAHRWDSGWVPHSPGFAISGQPQPIWLVLAATRQSPQRAHRPSRGPGQPWLRRGRDQAHLRELRHGLSRRPGHHLPDPAGTPVGSGVLGEGNGRPGCRCLLRARPADPCAYGLAGHRADRPSRTGMANHSVDGASAIASMLADSRIRAGRDMDGATHARIPDYGLSWPSLFLGKRSNYVPGSGGAMTTWERDWKLPADWKRWLAVVGAGTRLLHRPRVAGRSDRHRHRRRHTRSPVGGTSPAPTSGPSSTSTRAASHRPCWTIRHRATPRSRSATIRNTPELGR